MLTRRAGIRALLGVAALSVVGLPAIGQARATEPMTSSTIEDYEEAIDLLHQGKPDEAIYWFYRGQLRARIYLRAHPDEPPDRAPAVFASLNDTLGGPVNEYAFGDIPALVTTLDRVLAWHAANDDPATPKARFAAAHEQVTSGMIDFRNKILADRNSIRKKRRQNGLPNRI